jgi:hypothetical protein
VAGIRASVVDISVDQPRAGDRFLVDCNVWMWLSYPRFSHLDPDDQPRPHQLGYPQYIKKALSAKSGIAASSLTFSEIVKVVEETERKVYKYQSGQDVPLKQFRHGTVKLRAMATRQAIECWEVVTNMATETIDVHVTPNLVASAITRLKNDERLDGTDLLVMEAADRVGITQVLSDDFDFVTVNGISVFTANPRAIRAARQDGRLMSR